MVVFVGVLVAGGGDDHLHDAHRAIAIYLEEEALYLHFGESDSGETTVWDEGMPWSIDGGMGNVSNAD